MGRDIATESKGAAASLVKGISILFDRAAASCGKSTAIPPMSAAASLGKSVLILFTGAAASLLGLIFKGGRPFTNETAADVGFPLLKRVWQVRFHLTSGQCDYMGCLSNAPTADGHMP